MSISSEITLLNNTKQAIKASINAKGGNITNSTPFADYSTAIDNLPSGGSGNPLLTSIDVSDFSGTTFDDARSYITGVTIPNSVTSIGGTAFYYCSGLTSVNIPNSVTSIGNQAFSNCTGLTSIDIPNTVATIGTGVFSGCSGLTSVTISNSVTTISTQMFQNCSSLTGVTIPNLVTSIGGSAFNSCTGLTDITIPNSVTSIGVSAFNGCSHLTYFAINATTPPTLASSNAFTNTNNCPIYVPAASVAAYKAATQWSSLASRIYAIAQVATVDNTPVYNYDLGMTSSTTMITSTNMQKMPTGTSLELAEGIVDAGGSFGNYTSITLPSTFSSFDDQGMIGNTTTTLTCKATTPPTAERNDIGGANLTAIYVPAASVSDYQADAAWSGFSSIIQAISA